MDNFVKSAMSFRLKPMNYSLTVIIVWQVLMHSIFGCCGHAFIIKVDSAEVSCSRGEQSKKEASAFYSDGLATGEIVKYCYESPAKKHNCRHDSCHWLVSAKASIDRLLGFQFVSKLDLPIFLAPSTEAACSFALSRERRQMRTLPVRLHLMVGVLLT